MPRYIAFLGGINVGGHRITMDRLCALFEEMGFSDVSSFIASGNVLFSARKADTTKLETKIEKHLEDALGYKVPVLLRTPEEISAILGYAPFNREELESNGHTLHVCFLKTAADPNVISSFQTAMDDLHPRGREIYWRCRGRTMESLLKWPAIGRKTGVSTARNITMLRRLATVIETA